MKIRQENKCSGKQKHLAEQKLNAKCKMAAGSRITENKYPQFDLRTELQNEQFMSLLLQV